MLWKKSPPPLPKKQTDWPTVIASIAGVVISISGSIFFSFAKLVKIEENTNSIAEDVTEIKESFYPRQEAEQATEFSQSEILRIEKRLDRLEEK
jgi:hypothetical protein